MIDREGAALLIEKVHVIALGRLEWRTSLFGDCSYIEVAIDELNEKAWFRIWSADGFDLEVAAPLSTWKYREWSAADLDRIEKVLLDTMSAYEDFTDLLLADATAVLKPALEKAVSTLSPRPRVWTRADVKPARERERLAHERASAARDQKS